MEKPRVANYKFMSKPHSSETFYDCAIKAIFQCFKYRESLQFAVLNFTDLQFAVFLAAADFPFNTHALDGCSSSRAKQRPMCTGDRAQRIGVEHKKEFVFKYLD